MSWNIRNLFRRGGAQSRAPSRQKLFFETGPDHVYAIGDVHGSDDLLETLENRIAADAQALAGTKWLIMLGDYVDRGPKSAAVLDRLIRKPRIEMERFCLAGNHEEVMLDFIRNPATGHPWLELGGVETLRSYGIHTIPDSRQTLIDALRDHIPAEHIDFLAALPSLIGIPGVCFVHAGLEEDVALADQDDGALLWMRPNPARDAVSTFDFLTVHGHTPVKTVEVGNRRINVDTRAYSSGILSAVRLSANGEIHILQSS